MSAEKNDLLQSILDTRSEIDQLRRNLYYKETLLQQLESKYKSQRIEGPLSNNEISRYSRQLILPGFGVKSQEKLKKSTVLIVGAGGLGCPAAQYLAAAGIGRIGILDYDDVESTNLHRQILHTAARIGQPKVESARKAIEEINPHIDIVDFNTMAKSDNIVNIISNLDCDVVLDCSDNLATRYLLNDACVFLDKPLVSGSALQMDGQLTVYNYGKYCPCYRCIFPVPPPPESVTKCGDGGVLGAVTGVIGTLQALEAIKIITQLGDILAGRLLIFDGMRSTFRNIKLRGRRENCEVCSPNRMKIILEDYEQFCGMRATDKDYALHLLTDDERLSVEEYKEISKQSQPQLCFDVRPAIEFEICHLPKTENVPLKEILNDEYLKRFANELSDENFPIVVLCRRGNDSQIAVQHMKNRFPKNNIRDLIGGLHAWHYKIDQTFPIY